MNPDTNNIENQLTNPSQASTPISYNQSPQVSLPPVFFSSVAAFQPGTFIFSQKKGTFNISGQTITMLDEQQAPLFTIDMSNIDSVGIAANSGRIFINTKSPVAKYNVNFMISKGQFNASPDNGTSDAKLPGEGFAKFLNGRTLNGALFGGKGILAIMPLLKKLTSIFEQNGIKITDAL